MRNSRLRLADLPRLLLLEYPVRCLTCEERYFASVSNALKLHEAAKARKLERRRRQSNSV